MEYKDFRKQVNESFIETKRFTEKGLGLKLSLIELVELRNLVEFTTKIYLEDKANFVEGKCANDEHQIIPEYESALIFMNKNYGTQILGIEDHSDFDLNRRAWNKIAGFDYCSKKFQEMQNEMHNRIGY